MMNDRIIWKYRWNTLRQMMDNMIRHLEHQEELLHKEGDEQDIMISRFDTLRTLVTCLRRFGQNQFDFFYNGFDYEGDPNDKKKGYLKPSLQYPEDYVFCKTLDQIGYDLSLFQTIILQRETASELDDGERSRLYEALHTADRLAYKALKPAIDADLIENATVLTYFQKSPSVRLIPYAPIALVAIPHSCIALPKELDPTSNQSIRNASSRDFLAIPHEVGHYVYRHGQFNGKTLSEAISDTLGNEDDIMSHWLEEIFSDVYGCLVAGPVMALDFMNMMLNHSPKEFLSTSSHYPTPAVRPSVFKQILTDMKCHHTGEVLEKQWHGILKKNTRHVTPEVSQLGEGLKRVANAIYELETFETDIFSARDRWTTYNTPANKLYDEFANVVEHERLQLDDITPEARIITDRAIDDESNPTRAQLEHPKTNAVLREWTMGEADGLSTLWLEQLRKMALSHEPNMMLSRDCKVPPEVWSLVLSMNGWAIEGPTPGGGSPPSIGGT